MPITSAEPTQMRSITYFSFRLNVNPSSETDEEKMFIQPKITSNR